MYWQVGYWGHSTNTTLTRAQSSVPAAGKLLVIVLSYCRLRQVLAKTKVLQRSQTDNLHGCFQTVGVKDELRLAGGGNERLQRIRAPSSLDILPTTISYSKLDPGLKPRSS